MEVLRTMIIFFSIWLIMEVFGNNKPHRDDERKKNSKNKKKNQ